MQRLPKRLGSLGIWSASVSHGGDKSVSYPAGLTSFDGFENEIAWTGLFHADELKFCGFFVVLSKMFPLLPRHATLATL
jgi:hypothetical protein